MKRYAVGLTGGIASGKSFAEAYLSTHFEVVDADLLVHSLYANDRGLIQAIKDTFGPQCVRDSVVYRPALKNQVYQSPDKLKLLNQIVHPVVGRHLIGAIDEAREKKIYTLIVIPLLFENHWDSKLDHVLLVGCSPEIQVQRLTRRDSCSSQRAMEIIHNQMDEASRRARCDSLIINDGAKEQFEKKLEYWRQEFFLEEQHLGGD